MSAVTMAPTPPSGVASLWCAPQRARLVRLCTTIVGDPAVAEDLAQETLLEAWRNQHKVTDPTGAQAWVQAIARNVCRRWLSAQGRTPRPALSPATELADHSEALDCVLEREELVELLERALALLPAATRTALVAHYVEERSHAEIADRLGISADAVSMRVSRGKARLRYLIETTFADDAVAEGWVRRDEAGWRTTRLRCVECGKETVSVRHDTGEVAFRCLTCDPGGLTTRLPLDTPVFGSLVGGLRRPSAILARTASWALSYWSPTEAPGRVDCVRCGSSLPVQRYLRTDPSTASPTMSWPCRRGWFADCDTCGEQVSGSLTGLALALPEVRAARAREPRLLGRPVREVERDGRPAMVLSFGPPHGADAVSAVFLRDSLRLVHVDSAARAG